MGGILAAVVINQFETTLEKILALSFFFPVIMGMGGNTGTQAATIVVRGMATGPFITTLNDILGLLIYLGLLTLFLGETV